MTPKKITDLIITDKLNCHICEEILEGLENIDDECDVYGIHLVKIQDPQLAKRYSIKTFPALVYFRNGNPLLYEGTFRCLLNCFCQNMCFINIIPLSVWAYE
jgi:hypothetical protein